MTASTMKMNNMMCMPMGMMMPGASSPALSHVQRMM